MSLKVNLAMDSLSIKIQDFVLSGGVASIPLLGIT